MFAAGDAAREAEAAGADFVGADDLAAQIEGGMLDFDVTIATPDLMPLSAGSAGCSAPVASCRTPRPAPSPPTSAKAVTDFKGGKVEYRTDRHGNVHVPVGKVSFTRTPSSPTSPRCSTS